jgi:hypothetical protein
MEQAQRTEGLRQLDEIALLRGEWEKAGARRRKATPLRLGDQRQGRGASLLQLPLKTWAQLD